MGRGRGDTQELDSLVTSAVGGDELAERALLLALAPPLRRALARWSDSPADVEDALQECLLAVRAALPRFRGECSVVGFALGIARRRALVWRRSRRRERRREWEFSRLEAPLALGARLPHDEVLLTRRRLQLLTLLGALPRAQVEALVNRFVWGDSLSDIASESGVSVNTVRTRLRLALAALRRRLCTAEPALELFSEEDRSVPGPSGN